MCGSGSGADAGSCTPGGLANQARVWTYHLQENDHRNAWCRFEHMRAFCRYTRRRFECTHGGVLNLSTGGSPACQAGATHTRQHQHKRQDKTRQDKTRQDTTRHDTNATHTMQPNSTLTTTHTRMLGYVLVRQPTMILRLSAQGKNT